MFYGREKRVIVLRNIHSNLFEEAILVMKEDAGNGENANPTAVQGKPGGKDDFILREAETIINNYIKENKGNIALAVPKNSKKSRKSSIRNKIDNPKFMKVLIINSALIGSIAAAAFLLLRIF